MRKTSTEEIEGLKYTGTQMPATQGIECFKRLVAIIGNDGMRLAFFDEAEIAAFAKRAELSVDDARGQIKTMITSALGDALDKIDADFVKLLLTDIQCEAVRMHGAEKPVKGQDLLTNFDEHFAGEYMHLLKVLQFSIKLNFLNPTNGAL